MGQPLIVKPEGRTGRLGIPARADIKTWKHLVNYKTFHDINKEKLKLSYAGISFSKYMAGRIGGGHVIYHGAEPAIWMMILNSSKSHFSKEKTSVNDDVQRKRRSSSSNKNNTTTSSTTTDYSNDPKNGIIDLQREAF
jgi:hypothetical protein